MRELVSELQGYVNGNSAGAAPAMYLRWNGSPIHHCNSQYNNNCIFFHSNLKIVNMITKPKP